MSILPSLARRFSLPLSLVTALAAISTGCSSTESSTHFDPVLDGGGYPLPPSDEAAEGGGQDGAPQTGGSAGGDDGGELPPDALPTAPDDERVDNSEDAGACDAQANVTVFLSPDDSNSMSSPVQARESVLGDWGSVQSVAIRTWEFFNYYTFGYAPADQPGSIRVSSSMMRSPSAPQSEFLLQLGISSEALTAETRAPINVTLVLDTSGSMAGHPMEMLRQTCLAIASSLRADDVISIVTWNTDNAIVLESHRVNGANDPALLAQIEDLEASGSTDLHGGLTAGYELAEHVYDPDRINRIVLVSDGSANAGITDINLIAEHSGDGDEDGIYMVGVGVGDAASYYDDLMDTVTDAGKGASVFIGDEAEAHATFGEHFIRTMGVAVRDVRVQLDLPPGFEIVRSSAEEIGATPEEVEPQHLAPNDAMIFHQHLRTCAPEAFTLDAPLGIRVEFQDPLTFEPRQMQVDATVGELLEADPTPLLKGATVFAYAEGLKAYKRADRDARSSTIDDAIRALERAELALPNDAELAEIREVLEALTR